MPKKTIAADDLIYMFREELRPLIDGSAVPSVAIVPHPTKGWTAVISHKDRKWHPALTGHVAKIEAALRSRFDLEDSDSL